ncbi:MAG: HD domain-containing protein [Haloarculaceae archaeon]
MDTTDVETVFPELRSITDEALRDGVAAAWTTACADAGIETPDELRAVPWFPPVERDLGIPGGAETLVAHVRDVTACAVALAGTLDDRRDAGVDHDLLLAGALVHDVSKLAEFDGHDPTPVGDLLGHPYWGVHVVASAGLPPELAHVVLAHTGRTNVEPAFLEAELVKRADEAAASAIRLAYVDDLRDA